MILLNCLWAATSASLSIQDFHKKAESLNETGQYNESEKLYAEHVDAHINEPNFKTNYAALLEKMGKYEEILKLNEKSAVDPTMAAKAKSAVEILHSGDDERISTLYKSTCRNYQIIASAIKTKIIQGKNSELNGFFLRAAHCLNKNEEELAYLQGWYQFVIGDYSKAAANWAKVPSKANEAVIFTSLLREYEAKQAQAKYIDMLRIHVRVKNKADMDALKPSIYTHFLKATLKTLVLKGVKENKEGALEYAKQLIATEKDSGSLTLYLHACIIALNETVVRKEIEKYKSKLTSSNLREIENKLKLHETFKKEAKAAEDRRKQEEERKKQEQQRQQYYGGQQSSRGSGVSRAGKDFLEYYKILGVDKNTDDKTMKKAYKKKLRASMKMENKDEVQTKINKAYQVLSESEKKQLYDMGIDPDRPTEGNDGQGGGTGYGGYGQQRGASYGYGDDLGDIFQSFFSGGGGQDYFSFGGGDPFRQNSKRRTYYYRSGF
ncbi:hypothetical protein ENBRE01_0410 [Enteropsectra breve]|nr:hypothetical protein ENBRE01_0410 [Enteropsectra breve]